MQDKPFDIQILKLNWIKHVDDPTDLCVHGSLNVRIGDKTVVDEKDGDGSTLSATALNLLRTLQVDYKPSDFAGQLIPCCGFFMIATDDGCRVDISGCPSGFDWTIQHQGNSIRTLLLLDNKQLLILKITKSLYCVLPILCKNFTPTVSEKLAD